MASYTTNLNLKKPAGSENVAIGDINNNMDIIDNAYGTLNSFVTGTVTWNTENVTGDNARKNWFKAGRLVIASLEFTPISGKIGNNLVICGGLPAPFAGNDFFVYGENKQQMAIGSNGDLHWYYPTDQSTTNRIDITLVYFAQNA